MSNLFHVAYSAATPLAGVPILSLNLLVDAEKKSVAGMVHAFQHTDPTVQFHADVWGYYGELEQRIILTLDGNPSGPYCEIDETFHLNAELSQDWQSGIAGYRYFDGANWNAVSDAIVTVVKTTSDLTANVPHLPLPMFATAMQQEQGGGVDQMKSMAHQAKQFIDNCGGIQGALLALNKEIDKIKTTARSG